jgi:hypothetical protein
LAIFYVRANAIYFLRAREQRARLKPVSTFLSDAARRAEKFNQAAAQNYPRSAARGKN